MRDKINIFSFFSGAGFLDLGFELSGAFEIVYVNEFHKAFNDVYKYARSKMGIIEPKYGHHVKMLPRVEGDEDLLEKPLASLATFCATGNYTNAAKKVEEMQKRLERAHFTSYWP